MVAITSGGKKVSVLNWVAQTNSDLYDYDYDALYDYQLDAADKSIGWLFLFSGVWALFWLVIGALGIVGMWKVFSKAGRPGWAAIIPFYNLYILLKIAGREGWWIILFLIPFVNIIVGLIVAIDIAKAFGKSEVFGVFALWLFSVVGYLILGFGDAKYKGKDLSSGKTSNNTPQPANG